jgi:arabinan endo-1,5-alpha-L-arabinosidase
MKIPLSALFLGSALAVLGSWQSVAGSGRTSVYEPLILPDVHDPAQLVRLGNTLRLYASPVEWWAYSLNDRAWTFLGDDLYGGNNPDWDLGGAAYWAPSLVRVGRDRYRLYHSAVHDEDNHGSRIGFARGVVADGEIAWEPVDDYVVESGGYTEPFAIDPAVFRDDDQRHWLVYGSHAAGIWIVEIDPGTGLLAERPSDKRWTAVDDRFHHLADYGGDRYDENNIEAAYVYNHPENEFYYLFVNWGRCCSGVDSTYNIRVGRSDSPTGPYLDRDGRRLSEGGGSLFLDMAGQIVGDSRFVGPGHAGIYRHVDGRYYFSHHFYDAANDGTPSLAVWNLSWANGWPQIDRGRPVQFESGFVFVDGFEPAFTR